MAETLGAYTLERRIGVGGMADVFLARGPSGVCVVKRPHAHLSGNPDFIRMFLDEASLLAQLAHPGIARVFDLGHSGNSYYLAMEYVPGFDLMTISLEYERQGEWIAPELAGRVISDAAAALHYAHDAKGQNGQPLNLIHRDVTPHNILVSTAGSVKLIDFGVAKQTQSMHRTGAGLVKGKYPYMAPEQVSGKAIDRRVDVYALGLVLYELLANTRAIPGEIEVEQIDNARHSRIKPIEQVRANVPEVLRRILSGCLHPDPDGRYPTALDLHNDLETWLQMDGHRVGREDLLRLFRIVAADPTHQLAHAGLPGWGSDSRSAALPDEGRATTEEVVFPHGAPSDSDAHRLGPSDVARGDVPVPVPSPQPVPRSQPGLGSKGGASAAELAPTSPSMVAQVIPLVSEVAPITLKDDDPAGSQIARPPKKPESGNLAWILAAVLVLAAGVGLSLKIFSNTRPPETAPKPPVELVPPVADVAVVPPVPVGPVAVIDPGPKPPPENPTVPVDTTPKPAVVEKAHLTVRSSLEAEVSLDGTVLTTGAADLKPGKHTVVLTAKEGGFKYTATRTLKAGEQWAVAPAVGTLKVDLVPFGTLRVAGIEVLNGYSSKTLTLWEGRYALEAENTQAKKNFKREVVVKPGAEEPVVFNFLEQ